MPSAVGVTVTSPELSVETTTVAATLLGGITSGSGSSSFSQLTKTTAIRAIKLNNFLVVFIFFLKLISSYFNILGFETNGFPLVQFLYLEWETTRVFHLQIL